MYFFPILFVWFFYLLGIINYQKHLGDNKYCKNQYLYLKLHVCLQRFFVLFLLLLYGFNLFSSSVTIFQRGTLEYCFYVSVCVFFFNNSCCFSSFFFTFHFTLEFTLIAYICISLSKWKLWSFLGGKVFHHY